MLAKPEQIIQLVSSLLALILFVISYLAYRRERRKKFFILSSAFFFYSTMNFLDAADIFFPQAGEYPEIWGSLLNFVVLALFFLSMITKE
jgi:drug/metabolite transporter (DMT)-like permease